jgi:hypothetical protein
MNATPVPQHPRPDRSPEAEQLPPVLWTWSTPPPEDGECRHGISNPAWCAICNPALVAKDRDPVDALDLQGHVVGEDFGDAGG